MSARKNPDANRYVNHSLRVCIITPYVFVANEIAKRLDSKGFSTLVITVTPSKLYKHCSNYLTRPDRNNTVVFLKGIRSLFTSVITVFRFRPNIIQLYTGGGGLGFVLYPVVFLSKLLLGARVVSFIMEPVPRMGIRNRKLAWLETRLEILLSSVVITNTERLKRLIIGVHKVPPTRVFAFTNEWDVPCFTIPQSGEKEEEDWILFFGNVEDYKGLEYLILAEPLITSEIPRAKIVIAGRGQEKYYHLIRNKDNFLLLNKFVDYEEGSVLIKKSKIIVLPYKTGTVSGVIPVAYAFKKPIVATRVGCFDEVIKHGETGVLVEPHNPTELARALVYLLKDDELRRKLGEKGYEKLKRELSWDVFVSKLMVIYQKLISRRNRQSDSKTKMLIKRATILDLHKIYSFYEKISLDATTSFFYRRVLPRSVTSRIYFITRIALNILFKKGIFAMLLNNGSIIGLSHILVSRNKRYGEEGIVLLKGHRGKGLGRLLLFYALREAKREGLKALWAIIDVDNYPSIKLHQKLGFRILKVMPKAGSRYGRPVDAYLLIKTL